MTCAKNYKKDWWMCVKATASQIWDILRHSVVATTLLHQDPVDAAIYHLHLQVQRFNRTENLQNDT